MTTPSQNRYYPSSVVAARPKLSFSLVTAIRSVRFWVEWACFFLIATPFELEIGSGYGYAIKGFATIILLMSRLTISRANVDGKFAWIVVLALCFLGINISSISSRAASAFILILLGCSLGMLKSEEWRRRLFEIVTLYLIVHAGALVFSFIEFSLRGYVTDLHALIFSEASRGQIIGAAVRVAGFHTEPGTYAQWVLMALFLRSLLMRRVASPLAVFVGVTMVMTWSLWAVVGAALLLSAIILEAVFRANIASKVKFIISAFVLFQVTLVALAYLPQGMLEDGLAFLRLKSEASTESGLNKILALNELYNRLNELVLFGNPIIPGFCPTCIAPQDIGIWANFTYYFGLTPSLLIFLSAASLLLRGWGISFLPLLIGMMLWKATFYDQFLWILIGTILSRNAASRLRPRAVVSTRG